MNNLMIPMRLFRGYLPSRPQKAFFSWKHIRSSSWTKFALISGVAATGLVALATPVFASDMQAHPAKLPWFHNGVLSAYDHASVRRGYQVYKEVCAACHSMQYLAYRQLVNCVLTEEEAKADAAEHLVRDGPDDAGNMFDRPGRLTDRLPSPYPNTEAARAANNGAAPPDLTYIVKARHGQEDYVFHLLTGYFDPPTGRTVADGQYYNPYFAGGAISMARALYDDMIQYHDGTPATTSQMAKDVVSFLCWSSDRNHDQRKRVMFKVTIVLLLGTIIVGISKRKRWSNLKSRKLMYKNRPIPKDV
ncbi:Ubiquinol-cytochrome c reductase cytochrome c1 subunit [Paragonimus heterotremus]|uniref:Ubiquinol-cytochrome c reductase cytochrome c1 subunit n=1 Tax=Paragonimus heterotremus TaxID=100268 RepID=A0A8J4X035_9TREM|nr:Ubiquinol-cytochrome c reductase cytochrome c1 subunit [Paragonimus heterotremus]